MIIYLIITNTLLQRLLLGAIKILRNVTRYETWWEKESSLHILLIRTIVPKDPEWRLSSQLLLMESETAHIWKKLNYFKFNVFSLFAGDDVKMSDLELYLCIYFLKILVQEYSLTINKTKAYTFFVHWKRFGNYLSSLPTSRKGISFCLFCLLLIYLLEKFY